MKTPKPLSERMDYSRGFDRGNYGNAYESQDWEAWSETNGFDDRSVAYRQGMLVGFFSTYAISEIGDEMLAEYVATLRAKHGES